MWKTLFPAVAATSRWTVPAKAITATIDADHDSRETDILIASGKFVVDWQL
jgi:hypothetical protein